MNWFVEVVEYGSGKVVHRLGPTTAKKAEVVAQGLERNLHHEKFFVRVVEKTT